MELRATLAMVCDGPAPLPCRLDLARHLAQAGASVLLVPVGMAPASGPLHPGIAWSEPAGDDLGLWHVLAALDRRQPLDLIDLPGGPLGLRLVQASHAGLEPRRARLVVRQGEPAVLARARRQEWIASPWEPVWDFAERAVFEAADVQLLETADLGGRLLDLGWAVDAGARTALPAEDVADLYASVCVVPARRPAATRWPLVSVVAPASPLRDLLQVQTYPHLECVPTLPEARGSYVLLATPDSRPAPRLVEALVRALERRPDSDAVVPATRWRTPAGEVVVVPTGGPRWLAGLPHVLGSGPALFRRAALRDAAGEPLLALLARGGRVEVHPEPLVVRRTDGDPLAIPRDFPLLPLDCLSPAERHELWGMLTALVQTDLHPLAERERLAAEEASLRAELERWPHRLVDWLDPLFRLVPRRAKQAVRGWLQRLNRWLRRSA